MRRFIFPLLLLALLPLRGIPALAQDSGTFWLLTYYNSPDLSGAVVGTGSVPDLNLNFSGGGATPVGVNLSQFSMRGQTQRSFAEGTYQFNAAADSGVRLFVDGALLIDTFAGESSALTFLDAGLHTLGVEYVQTGGGASVSVNWQQTGGAIPDAPLPGVAGDPLAQGSVFNVEGLSVRSGPYLGASRLEIIAPGIEYPVFARNDEEGEFTWFLVQVQDFIEVTDDITGEVIRQFTGDPTVGWVSGRYFLITTGSADNVPPLGTPFENPNLSPTGVTGITTSNLRLRQLPSYRTPTLATLDWGASLEVLGRTEQANQPHWYFVRTNGQIGWVYAPYVNTTGDLDAVPRY